MNIWPENSKMVLTIYYYTNYNKIVYEKFVKIQFSVYLKRIFCNLDEHRVKCSRKKDSNISKFEP